MPMLLCVYSTAASNPRCSLSGCDVLRLWGGMGHLSHFLRHRSAEEEKSVGS